MRLRSGLAAALVAAVVLVLPAAAGATLVYQTGISKTTVWAANDDGTGAHRIAAGRSPKVSPDGQWVSYGNRFSSAVQTLQVAPVAGGPARTILRRWREIPYAWSPDGRYIVTASGPELGPLDIVLVEVATGAVRKLARGNFSSASFSPDSTQLVYGRTARDAVFPTTNLWIAAVAGGAPRPLTTDGHSLYPLWGPNQIAYVRYARPTGRYRKVDGPKYNLWLVDPDGSARRQLTHDRVPYLLTGLVPTAWSGDGTRLLTQFGGQDTSYPVTVDPATGAERRIGPRRQPGIIASALSRDGAEILGYTWGFEASPRNNVVAIPYAGGRERMLVRHASLPDWSR